MAEALGQDFYSLDEFQAAFPASEQHSISALPGYLSNDDLHLEATSKLVGRGAPNTLTLTDIDGETRHAHVPDIGAGEQSLCYLNSDTLPSTVSGFVTSSNGSPLFDSKVLLIRFDLQTGQVWALDTAWTDAGGYFSFTTDAALVFLKAIPDSTAFPDQLPTYFGASPAIQSATCLGLDSAAVQANFSTLQGINPGGPGFIAGLVTEGAGFVSADPVAGLPIILINENGEPVGLRLTDAAGYFAFGDIPLGSYRFWVDSMGIKNNLAPAVALSGAMPELPVLEFELNPGYLDLQESSLPQPQIFIAGPLLLPCHDSIFLSASATASGGIPPFTFSWSNGQTGGTVSLPSGQHSLTLTDANGQTDVLVFNIGTPPELSFLSEITQATCAGCNDGGIILTPSGGTPPYAIQWENGLQDFTLANLEPGNYPFTLMDGNGCMLAGTAVVEFPLASQSKLPDFKFIM